MAKIIVLHGPNLNLLGQREPKLYGKLSLEELNKRLMAEATGHELSCFQTNKEHEFIDQIHLAKTTQQDAIIINPAAWTHTSIAIRDALLAVNIPFFEVHLSNPMSRETFRHKSYLSDLAQGVVSGLGSWSYIAALHAAIALTQ
jgi:3-dehydroquinate dehydratase-2